MTRVTLLLNKKNCKTHDVFISVSTSTIDTALQKMYYDRLHPGGLGSQNYLNKAVRETGRATSS